MRFEFYNVLPQEAIKIRKKIFMEEQGFSNEFDEIDQRAIHLVAFDQDEPIGCARMFNNDNVIIFGRIAVLKEKRHLHIGTQILQALE